MVQFINWGLFFALISLVIAFLWGASELLLGGLRYVRRYGWGDSRTLLLCGVTILFCIGSALVLLGLAFSVLQSRLLYPGG